MTNAKVPKKTKLELQKVNKFIFVCLLISIISFGAGNLSSSHLKILKQNKVELASHEFDLKSADEVYDFLKENFDGEFSKEAVENGIKDGLAKATADPYTVYMTEAESEDFQSSLDGSFSGIGAELGKENDSIIIISPIKGYPAEKAGLKPKDIILKIDETETTDMTVDKAVSLIRGEAGTSVKLELFRSGEVVKVDITRQEITIPSVKHRVEDGIGILEISRFSKDTSSLTDEAINEFQSQNVRGVILDLRNNPGGYLDQAVLLSSNWLDEGEVVLDEKKAGKSIKQYKSVGGNELKDMPTVVLINEGSASASEITAGALHDSGKAKLVGAKSFGKGSVQTIQELNSGGTLKVTIARWFTPSGKNIDKEGIEPDEKVELTAEDAKNNLDPQLQKAKSLL